MRARGLALALGVLAAPLAAQEPLSPIDWLTDVAREAEAERARPPEPPAVEAAEVAPVEVQALAGPEQRAYGLAPATVTGLPETMWRGSDATDLAQALAKVPARTAAMTALLQNLLISEAFPPETGSIADWLGARAARLTETGAVAQARAVLDLVPEQTPEMFQRWAALSLLDDAGNAACTRWAEAPWLTDDMRLRVFCLARGGDWTAAITVMHAAEGLEMLAPNDAALLLRFLDPALAEDLPPLDPPSDPDPLTFRLFEAIGEPQPTNRLPRAFAVSQLGGDAGWKAQIEAAERLVRSGALPPDVLWAIYRSRTPAASGGTWERVAAVQAVDRAALQSRDALAEAAQTALDRLQPQGLGVALAHQLAPALPAARTDDPVALAHLRLLAGVDEAAGAALPSDLPDRALIEAVAQGFTPPPGAAHRHAAGITLAFAMRPSLPRIEALLAEDRWGEALIEAMELFDAGAQGDGPALTRALRIFQALGLEELARLAALELLILDPLQ